MKTQTILLFFMTNSPDLLISLKTTDETIHQIKNSKKESTGKTYTLNTQEITIRTLLYLIDNFHIYITPVVKKNLHD